MGGIEFWLEFFADQLPFHFSCANLVSCCNDVNNTPLTNTLATATVATTSAHTRAHIRQYSHATSHTDGCLGQHRLRREREREGKCKRFSKGTRSASFMRKKNSTNEHPRRLNTHIRCSPYISRFTSACVVTSATFSIQAGFGDGSLTCG